MLRNSRFLSTRIAPMFRATPATIDECLRAKVEINDEPILRLVTHQSLDVCIKLVKEDYRELKHVHEHWRPAVMKAVYPALYDREFVLKITPRSSHQKLLKLMDQLDDE